MSNNQNITAILIGYAGHAFVVADILRNSGVRVVGYCDQAEKQLNPLGIPFLGQEQSAPGLTALREHDYFVSIGDNRIRKEVTISMQTLLRKDPLRACHTTAVVSEHADVAAGTMIAPRVVVNALAEVGLGVILNTGCVVEHECQLGAFAHIAPGAILAGNVRVGAGSFIGAGAVVKQGVTIGKGAIIGAGSVIIRDVPDSVTVVGNPGRILPKNMHPNT